MNHAAIHEVHGGGGVSQLLFALSSAELLLNPAIAVQFLKMSVQRFLFRTEPAMEGLIAAHACMGYRYVHIW